MNSDSDFLPDASRDRAYFVLSEMIDEDHSLEFVDDRYHVNGDFSHLRARLKAEGKISRKLAVMADGSVWSIHEADRMFGRQHAATWGRTHPSFARRIAKANQDAVMPTVIFFDGEKETISTIQGYSSYPVAWRKSEVNDIALIVAGFTPSELKEVAFLDGIGAIYDGDVTPVTFGAPVFEGVSNYTRSHTSFNSANTGDGDGDGYYGAGVRVGLSEVMDENCGIWVEHDALDFNSVGYMYPSGRPRPNTERFLMERPSPRCACPIDCD